MVRPQCRQDIKIKNKNEIVSGELEVVAEHVRDQRLSLMTKMYSALVFVIVKTLRGVCTCS